MKFLRVLELGLSSAQAPPSINIDRYDLAISLSNRIMPPSLPSSIPPPLSVSFYFGHGFPGTNRSPSSFPGCWARLLQDTRTETAFFHFVWTLVPMHGIARRKTPASYTRRDTTIWPAGKQGSLGRVAARTFATCSRPPPFPHLIISLIAISCLLSQCFVFSAY